MSTYQGEERSETRFEDATVGAYPVSLPVGETARNVAAAATADDERAQYHRKKAAAYWTQGVKNGEEDAPQRLQGRGTVRHPEQASSLPHMAEAVSAFMTEEFNRVYRGLVDDR